MTTRSPALPLAASIAAALGRAAGRLAELVEWDDDLPAFARPDERNDPCVRKNVRTSLCPQRSRMRSRRRHRMTSIATPIL
jgi:hypothetical protein